MMQTCAFFLLYLFSAISFVAKPNMMVEIIVLFAFHFALLLLTTLLISVTHREGDESDFLSMLLDQNRKGIPEDTSHEPRQ